MRFTTLVALFTSLAAASPPRTRPTQGLEISAAGEDGSHILGADWPIFEKCTPGQYTCYANVRSQVLVCNAKGKWQLSADCGRGAACCERGGDKKSAYCVC